MSLAQTIADELTRRRMWRPGMATASDWVCVMEGGDRGPPGGDPPMWATCDGAGPMGVAERWPEMGSPYWALDLTDWGTGGALLGLLAEVAPDVEVWRTRKSLGWVIGRPPRPWDGTLANPLLAEACARALLELWGVEP